MTDLISRRAAIEALGKRPIIRTGSNYEIAQRNQYDIDKLAIETVLSAEPERKKGKWIFKPTFPNDDSEFPMGILVCSICGSHHSNSTPCNYCDNCGADMRDGQ